MERKGNYIIYVDESGDHGIKNIDAGYPIFVLSFCCFKIEEYIHNSVSKIQEFKFKYYNHDQVILHEHHIRKQKGDFSFLRTDQVLRENFLNDLNELIANINFEIYAIVIDKQKLTEKYLTPNNPYNLGMQFGLEIIYKQLVYNNDAGENICFVFEKRGKKEDDALELEFRRICSGEQRVGWKNFNFDKIRFEPIFADKKSNSTGLQLADLTARPIGLHYMRPNQNNKAFDILKSKIKRIKVFP